MQELGAEAGERKEEWKRAEIETLLTVLHIEIISNCAGAGSGGRGEEGGVEEGRD